MLCKNAKTDICKTVSSIFHGAGLALEMFRHQPQIVTKRFIALFEVVSNFAAFKRCSRSVRNPLPSHPLPFLQLTDLAVQNIGLRHAAGLLKRPVLADFLARTGVGRTIGRKILTLLFALAVTVGAAASAFGQMTLRGDEAEGCRWMFRYQRHSLDQCAANPISRHRFRVQQRRSV
jgi:hypothetical protein